MRGKAQPPPFRAPRAGITPAHAGKSRPAFDTKRQSWDHPRPCGEKQPSCMLARVMEGSPPPMRGKAIDLPYDAAELRITPAHAGKRDSET